MENFISSVLIWTPVRRNTLIHCILSNCLFWGSTQFWTLAGFQAVVHITLPACSDFLLVHPRYLVKTFFSSSAGKTSCPFTLDYRVHLLRRSVFFCLAAKGTKYFRPNNISTFQRHLVPSLPLRLLFHFSRTSRKMPINISVLHWVGCCCHSCKLRSLIE